MLASTRGPFERAKVRVRNAEQRSKAEQNTRLGRVEGGLVTRGFKQSSSTHYEVSTRLSRREKDEVAGLLEIEVQARHTQAKQMLAVAT